MKLPSFHLDVKLIALDLDDTLLTDSLEISFETVTALHKAAVQGIRIVICSGRAVGGIMSYAKKLALTDTEEGRYIIAINGARIIDLRRNISVYSRNLDFEILSFVLREAEKRELAVQVCESSTAYCNVDTKWARLDSELCSLDFKAVADFEQFLRRGFPKILISAPPEKINSFLPQLQESLVKSKKAQVFTSKPYFLEVMPFGCAKGESLLRLCGILGIQKEQTLAFGDSMNDESMIKLAGYGVAMLNGNEYIKNIARYITRYTNQQNGIADFLNNYVL